MTFLIKQEAQIHGDVCDSEQSYLKSFIHYLSYIFVKTFLVGFTQKYPHDEQSPQRIHSSHNEHSHNEYCSSHNE